MDPSDARPLGRRGNMTTSIVRWLSRNDVARANLPLASALDVIEETLRDHGNGTFENPPKMGSTRLATHSFTQWLAGFQRNAEPVLNGLPVTLVIRRLVCQVLLGY